MEISGYIIIDTNTIKKATSVENLKLYLQELQGTATQEANSPIAVYGVGDNNGPDVPTDPEPTPTDSGTSTDNNKEKINKLKDVINNNKPCNIKLDKNKLWIEGKKTSREDVDEYLFSVSGRCLVTSQVPKIEEDEATQYYDKYVQINRAIRIICNSNMDILSHEAFELVVYELDITVPIRANSLVGVGIINLIDLSDIEYSAIKEVIDTGLDEIKKIKLPELDWEGMFKRQGGNYADVYLKPGFSNITNGKIETENELSTTGVAKEKYVWKGEYPLDKLIYTIQSNLDILLMNNKIKGDIYGNLYATLMAQAIQSATILEQARLQAYEQASQFQIKTMVEYYLGAINGKLSVVKTLAEVQTQFLQKSIYQAQIKLYNIQAVGFKSNNINKLFTAQLEGASTAYSSGMLEYPPAIYNNADLMSGYTDVGTNMSIL